MAAPSFEAIASGPLPFATKARAPPRSASLRSVGSRSLASKASLAKRRPRTAEAARSAAATLRRGTRVAAPLPPDPFDPSASNFGRFNSHYPRPLREYFRRPRTAAAEMPRRLGARPAPRRPVRRSFEGRAAPRAARVERRPRAPRAGKVQGKFERLSTYGLMSEDPRPMKTQLDLLRGDPRGHRPPVRDAPTELESSRVDVASGRCSDGLPARSRRGLDGRRERSRRGGRRRPKSRRRCARGAGGDPCHATLDRTRAARPRGRRRVVPRRARSALRETIARPDASRRAGAFEVGSVDCRRRQAPTHGTMTDGAGRAVPWDDRHHNTYSRCNHVFHEIHREFFGSASRLERVPIHEWRGPSRR